MQFSPGAIHVIHDDGSELGALLGGGAATRSAAACRCRLTTGSIQALQVSSSLKDTAWIWISPTVCNWSWLGWEGPPYRYGGQ